MDYDQLGGRFMATNESLSRNSDKYPIKIIVNVNKARRNGVIFYKASNGVILSYDKIPKSCLFFCYVINIILLN